MDTFFPVIYTLCFMFYEILLMEKKLIKIFHPLEDLYIFFFTHFMGNLYTYMKTQRHNNHCNYYFFPIHKNPKDIYSCYVSGISGSEEGWI